MWNLPKSYFCHGKTHITGHLYNCFLLLKFQICLLYKVIWLTVVWKQRDKAVSDHIKLFESNKPDTAGATVVTTGGDLLSTGVGKVGIHNVERMLLQFHNVKWQLHSVYFVLIQLKLHKFDIQRCYKNACSVILFVIVISVEEQKKSHISWSESAASFISWQII